MISKVLFYFLAANVGALQLKSNDEVEELDTPLIEEVVDVSSSRVQYNKLDSKPKAKQETWGELACNSEVKYVLPVLLGSLLFGTTIGYTGNTENAFKQNQEMSDEQFSWFGTIMNVGAMIGAFAAGPLANSLGRRTCLQITALVFIAGYILLGLSPHQHYCCLMGGRTLTGIGSGMVSTAVPTYITEVSKTHRKGNY